MTRDEAIEFIQKMKNSNNRKESNLEHINHGMYALISYIYEHDNHVTSGMIAKEMNVSTARIAKLANKLEEKGLLVRQPDTIDLRKTYFSLTDKGIQKYNNNMERFIGLIIYLFDNLNEGEMEEFLRLSAKLKELGCSYLIEHPMENIMEVENV